MQKFEIRNATLADFEAIKTLNDAFVEFTSPMDVARIEHLHNRCAYHKVIEQQAESAQQTPQVVGFLMAMAPSSDYDSENYRWFDRRYKNFLYIDRIVVDPSIQGIGLGRKLYNDIFDFAREKKIGHICCEYNLIPANPISANFHNAFGFHQVGRLSDDAQKKVVSMQLANAM